LLILAIGFSNVFGLQYLIPSGQDKKFTISVTCGAIANFSLNLVLIKFLNSYGAAIATVIAESVVTIVMFCFLRKNISLLEILKISTKYLISGAIMGVPCVIVGKMLSPSIINTFLIVAMGVLIYFVSLLVMKDPFLLELLTRLTGGLKLRKSK
jgi:O-antigen/teichoic acid export membrane protein